jgi:hypothetical protein
MKKKTLKKISNIFSHFLIGVFFFSLIISSILMLFIPIYLTMIVNNWFFFLFPINLFIVIMLWVFAIVIIKDILHNLYSTSGI